MAEVVQYRLTEHERALLLELDAGARAAVELARQMTRGALALIVRQQRLNGEWELSEDKTVLMKTEAK